MNGVQKCKTYAFVTEEGGNVQILLEKSTWKLTVEICVNGQCVGLEEPLFLAGYWLYPFRHAQNDFLVVLKELDYGLSYEAYCYQNGNSLTDGDTVENFKKRIEDPRFMESADSKRMRRRDLIGSVVGSVIAAVLILLSGGFQQSVGEYLFRFFGTLAVYWGYRSVKQIMNYRNRIRLLKFFRK